MNSTTPTTLRRLAAPSATVASLSLAVAGVVQITDPQSGEATVTGIEHLTLACLTITALSLIPVVLFLGRLAGGPRGAYLAAAGMGLLAPLTLVSNVRGSDPSFFAAVAAPANLLWLAGLIVLAVALKRSGRVPAALAIALPFTWVLSVPLSLVGGGLIAAAYWLVVGWMARHGELDRGAAPSALRA